MPARVPTVKDLRVFFFSSYQWNFLINPHLKVKLCYICREEEHADARKFLSSLATHTHLSDPLAQEGLPKAWTHPCNCTLIAHEQCLLTWIQTSQGTASRAPNALKCPQCGTQYEMESDEPPLLKGLAGGNRLLQRMGRYFTVFGVAVAVGVVSTSQCFYFLFRFRVAI